ncbi:MAG: IPT/TIG domain-containing protein [Planctomycetota bacterium]|nr:IPT/TIG domain-containing protein [Planctomycetota bacterium]
MRNPFGFNRWVVVLIVLLAVGLGAEGCKKKHRSKKPGGPAPGTPLIIQVLPADGLTSGGDLILVYTQDFTDDFMTDLPQVMFDGTLTGTPTPLNSTTLTVRSPPYTGGQTPPVAVDVTVVSNGGLESATLLNGFTYTSTPAGVCSIISVNPASGDAIGGDTVTINGTNFDVAPNPPPTVDFGLGNTAPSVTVVSATQLTVVTPAGPPTGGTVNVIVTNQASVCVLPNGYLYIDMTPQPCTVTSVAPTQGTTLGGDLVFINGSNFDVPPAPAPTVEFGTNVVPNSDVTVLNSTQIRISATPPGLAAGMVDVAVTTLVGRCSQANAFTYVDPPPPPMCTATSVSPGTGPEFGGNVVSIFGTGFVAGSTVDFGGTPSPLVTYVTDMELTAELPAGVGTVGITVGIGGAITCTLPGAYAYIGCGGQPCQVQRVNPNSGKSGDIVDVEGGRLEVGAFVFFGTAQATVVDAYVNVPNFITVMVPVSTGQTVDVDVWNPSGACCSRGGAFSYTGCFITSISRLVGPPSGGQPVFIDGGGFVANPPPDVWFGTELAIPQAASSTQILVLTPPGNGQAQVPVRVDNAGGDSCSYCCYNFGECTFTSIVPDNGGTNGGTTVTITGSGFDPNSMGILVGGHPVYPPFDIQHTPTQIVFRIPPSPTGGTKDIEIINETIPSRCTYPAAYTYNLPGGGPCSITSVSPDNGYLGGGTRVTITGTDFDAGTGVMFFTVGALNVNVINSTTLECDTPPYGGGAGAPVTVDVWVMPTGQDPCLLSGGFTYTAPSCPGGCSVSTVSPTNGAQAGGNIIRVTGTGFCDFGPVVIIGGQSSPQVTYISATQLDVEVPPSVSGPGQADIIYADASGCFIFPAYCCYTYN